MKNCLIFIFTLTVGLLSGSASSPTVNIGPQDISQDEIGSVVREFWQSSIEGDDVVVQGLTSATPKDFYLMFNRCMTPREEQEYFQEFGLVIPDGDPALGDVKKALSEYDMESNRKSVGSLSARIRRYADSEFRISEFRQNGRHAIVRVVSGPKPGQVSDANYLFMNREHSNWKIFKAGRSAGFEDGYFGETDCSDVPLTRLPWVIQGGRQN